MLMLNRLSARIAWHVGPVLAALIALVIAKEVDTRYFPAVTDFIITSMRQDQTGVLIEGQLNKVRDCRFLEVVAYGDQSRPVQVQFLDRQDGSIPTTRAVRVQMWGPWHVTTGSASLITLMARHECHALWDHSIILTNFPVKVAK